MAFQVDFKTKYAELLNRATVDYETLDIEEAFELFQYQGFSIELIFGLMSNSANLHGRDLLRDVMKLIVIGVSRGTKLEKVKARMSASGKAVATELFSIYNVKDGVKNRESITIGRVISCFPVQTLVAYCQTKYVSPFKVSNWPSCLSFSSAPALFPHDVAEKWFTIWLDWSSNFSHSIGGSTDVETYGRAVMNGNLMADEYKIAVLCQFLVMVIDIPVFMKNDMDGLLATRNIVNKAQVKITSMETIRIHDLLAHLDTDRGRVILTDDARKMIKGKITDCLTKAEATDQFDRINAGGVIKRADCLEFLKFISESFPDGGGPATH